MERLFAVYKVKNGSRTLLGGLAQTPSAAERGEPAECWLLAVARKKFADSLDESSMVVLEEEP